MVAIYSQISTFLAILDRLAIKAIWVWLLGYLVKILAILPYFWLFPTFKMFPHTLLTTVHRTEVRSRLLTTAITRVGPHLGPLLTTAITRHGPQVGRRVCLMTLT